MDNIKEGVAGLKLPGEGQVVNEDIARICDEIKNISPALEGKTLLIAGGAGFLGKYILLTLDYLNKYVFNTPCKVIVLDNFITGMPENAKANENIKIIKQNISEPFKIEENIDYIMHAASLASPRFYNKYRLETINVGFLGTKNLLELAKEKNVKSFLFFSSSEVYGDPFSEFVPTNEEYRGNVSFTGPRACYDEPKRIGETLCMNYADVYNIPVKIVRPFNVYGPGMRLDDGRVVTNFVVLSLKGEKVPVYGHGAKTRTFCYVSDATVGWFKILLSDFNREAFNIGYDEQEIAMKHLAELVIGLVGNEKAEINLMDTVGGIYGTKSDPNRRCPDLTKARTMLNYEPKINLVKGIKRFIEWAKEELAKETSQNQNQNHSPPLIEGEMPWQTKQQSSFVQIKKIQPEEPKSIFIEDKKRYGTFLY